MQLIRFREVGSQTSNQIRNGNVSGSVVVVVYIPHLCIPHFCFVFYAIHNHLPVRLLLIPTTEAWEMVIENRAESKPKSE